MSAGIPAGPMSADTSAGAMSAQFAAPQALRVVDLAAGMAAGLVTRSLIAAGMRVDRIAPAGDKVFDEIYPAHRYWRDGAQAADAAAEAELLAAADVCLIGGEDHPEVATRRDAEALAAAYPKLIVVDLSGYVPGDSGGAEGEPEHRAVDLLVQARSGLTFEHFSDRPVYFNVLFPTFGQALLALYGLWAALVARLNSGHGEVVTASLHQGSVFFLMPFWEAAENPDAEFNKATPKDVKHLIFECADGEFIQFVMGVPQAVKKLYAILEIDQEVDPNDVGIPKVGATPDKFFGDRPLIGSHVAKFPREELLTRAREVGLPVAPVLRPGEFWDDPQLAANELLVERDGARVVADPFRVTALTEAPEVPVTAGPGPLSGLRVIDFGTFVAGPFSGRMLADLGAEVIKFESLQGDPNRGLQRHYLAVQMGKRAMVVDLKDPRGKEILDKLVAGADLVMHNWRVGVPERLGVSPAELRRLNPSIMTLGSLSFGPVGPRAKDPGFDMIIQALLGMQRRAGGPEGEPLWFRAPYLDYGAGVMGAVAALMAIYERRVTGRVADVWSSLLNTGMFLMSDQIQLADGFAGVPETDRDLLGTGPTNRLYQVADGWLAVVARTTTQAAALWQTLLGDAPMPAGTWGQAETDRLADALRSLSLAEATDRLTAAGVWVEECRPNGLADLLASETARATGFCATRPDDRFGHLYGAVGQLVTFGRSAVNAETLRGAPARGQHTRELLGELGYPETEIDQMYAAGVVA